MEIWKPVLGYEGLYEVSNQGRVRSLDRYVPNPLTGGMSRRRGKQLKLSLEQGYHRLALYVDGIEKHKHVHQLVAEAFIGPIPAGLCVLHKDDQKLNNTPSNLYFGTQKHNGEDRVKNDRSAWGSRHHAASLNEDQVRKILALKGKMPNVRIAERFGTTASAVSHIYHGWSWTNLTGISNARRP